jgi:hypothetical protein
VLAGRGSEEKLIDLTSRAGLAEPKLTLQQ